MLLAFRRSFLFNSLLKCLKKASDHVMVLQLLSKDEALDGVIISEKSNKVLEKESLAVGEEILGRIYLLKKSVLKKCLL